MNVQGLLNNFNELEVLINEANFDWICLSETHLKDEDDSEISIKGYNIIRCDSSSKHTGGVAMFVKKEWQYEILNNVAIDKDIWWLVVKCVMNEHAYVVVVTYRSPSRTARVFCEYFEQWMDDLVEYNGNIVVMGDFNVNWNNNNDTYKKVIEQVINDNGCKQMVNENTRITRDTETMIDLIVTNIDHMEVKTNVKLKISDHESILVTIDVVINEQTSEDKTLKIRTA